MKPARTETSTPIPTDTDTDTDTDPDAGPDGSVVGGPDAAVDPDLPDAFRGAVQVETTMGGVWNAEPCDAAAASVLKATVVDGNVRVLFEGCFACEVVKDEAFVQQTDDGVQILFRIGKDPKYVALFKSGCVGSSPALQSSRQSNDSPYSP